MSIKILPFEPKYAVHFRDLNLAWLKKYFQVEAKDVVLLENCQESILDVGGFIFLAEHNGKIVGCFSFIPYEEKVFELGKMAVDPDHQGLKIGQELLSFAIEFAKENHWKSIVLYSSTKLDTALHIYRKYGFVEVELEKEIPYERSDIKMELTFNAKN
ncbi:GNAT family N-acetyltransferase [Ulvibacterium sp.]|uniref:GNAT family N-acetyltransferase n=1 Tax=Ulvibacterium sp. TaxID=2665914 RepID=UPI00260AD09E|nr:GNAT family N-acetyltransferase [Ulvibacterium sp.]